jgi:hypothetical protein
MELASQHVDLALEDDRAKLVARDWQRCGVLPPGGGARVAQIKDEVGTGQTAPTIILN